MRACVLIALLLAAVLAPGTAVEAVDQALIPYLADGYRYRVVALSALTGFEQPGFNDAEFGVGNAGFGSGGFCPLDSTVRTTWSGPSDLLLRKTFTLPASTTPGSVRVAVAIDNDVQVWVNGQDVSGGMQASENCAVRNRFVFPVPNSALNFGGQNLVAVRARDRGGIAYVDIEVRADVAPVPQLANVRVLDTISTAAIDLDATSFSRPPTSITTDVANNRTVIEWRFTSIAVNEIQDLAFDVVLKNPVPNENRLVSHKVEVFYTAVNGNPVRTELPPLLVHVLASGFSTTVATSKPQYTANEPVPITVTITNVSEFARVVDVPVLVEDSQGVPLRTITTFAAQSFGVGETKTFNVVGYNTGRSPAGDYRARARLLDATHVVGEATAAFTIQPVRQATSTIAADKLDYSSNEAVALTSRVISQSPNTTLTRLEATVTVRDAAGLPIFSETRAVADLLADARADLKTFTNTGTHRSGAYSAQVDVRSDGTPLTSASTTFRILSSLDQAAALVGSVGVTPSSVIVGEQTTMTYTLQNIGNEIDLPSIRADILVVDPETELAVRVITNDVGLNGREVFTDAFAFNTSAMAPQAYLVVLQGTVAGITKSLASASLVVKPVPNGAPTADAGPDQLGLVGQMVALDGTASSDPDGNPLTFRWHIASTPLGSHLTDASLVGGDTATPSVIPDVEGTYVLALVVNDGLVDSGVDTVSVFVNPAPSFDLHPETINLKSNGGANSVTGVLRSPVLSAFAFFTATDGVTVTAAFTLESRYIDEAGNPVVFVIPAEDSPASHQVEAVDLDDDGHVDAYQLTLKFDRQRIIAAFKDAAGQFRIGGPTDLLSTVIGNGLAIGSDTNQVILP